MLLYILFVVLVLWVFVGMLRLAIRACWGLLKILFGVIFLPVALVGMAAAGVFSVAMVIALGVGIVLLLCSLI